MLARPILIMAGGTGGHVYPALAVAGFLHARGVTLYWLGSRRGLENRLVPRAGYRLFTLPVSGLRRRGLLRLLLAPAQIGLAVAQAIVLILRLRPGVVLGMGGFASGPGGIAAWLCGRPLIIHEQNANPGLTNRILSRFATAVLEAFPGSFTAARAAEHTGNPVRAEITALPPPEQRRAGPGAGLRILIFGGSQGAHVLNTVVPQAIAQIGPQTRVAVLHQTGAAERDAVAAAYQAAGVPAEVCAYIEDMAAAYADADLVISRAGAMTIAEIAAAGVASILVPLPAVDDHQTANARYLVERGAAILLPQPELDVARLVRELTALAADRARIETMARCARAAAMPDATARVAARCLERLDA
jgi:UDP-N-acetylglucosamine--N-acetylmuramyl-(pentapeptide) pyrophosphoryl-undecaprenol N-acetylglucosamine transferase